MKEIALVIAGSVLIAVCYGLTHVAFTATLGVEHFPWYTIYQGASPMLRVFLVGVNPAWWIGLICGVGCLLSNWLGFRPNLTAREVLQRQLWAVLAAECISLAVLFCLLRFVPPMIPEMDSEGSKYDKIEIVIGLSHFACMFFGGSAIVWLWISIDTSRQKLEILRPPEEKQDLKRFDYPRGPWR